jgi:outer membrane protein assembly factor BamE (lipoprotein component of BamABCDE complex)
MSIKSIACSAVAAFAGIAWCCGAASAAYGEEGWSAKIPTSRGGLISDQKAARVLPGLSTKAQIQSLLGTPWRVVQFNDCGMSMPGQADETWDYRGKDSQGSYRLHIEFDDRGVADLVAKIPEHVPGGKGTPAKVSPSDSQTAMKM